MYNQKGQWASKARWVVLGENSKRLDVETPSVLLGPAPGRRQKEKGKKSCPLGVELDGASHT